MLETEFFFAPPKIAESGKNKNRYALANTYHLWHRWAKTKIKQRFIQEMTQWNIPKNESEPMRCGSIEFTIYRNDYRRMDSDSVAFPLAKWVLDIFVKQGWLLDDDKVQVIHHVPVLGVKDQRDKVLIHVKAQFYEKEKCYDL